MTMGAERLGRALLELDTDDSRFGKGLDAAERQVDRSMERMGASVAAVGAGMTAAVTVPLVAFASASVKAFQEQERAVAGVEAALASMGPAAGRSFQQLQASAEEMQRTLAVDADAVMGKVTANLLTFGNIAGDVFDRAQLAAVNLSARLGTDLQSSAIQLGKALNDPIRGVTALQRVGVAFSAEQRDMIKAMVETGRAAEAQGLILAELERQYGGQAAAIAATTSGQTAAMALAWGDFKEAIGAVIVEVLPPLVSALTGLLQWLKNLDQETLKWVVGIAAVAAAVGPLLLVLGPAIIIIGKLVAGFASLIPVIAGLTPVIIKLAPVILKLLGPIGLAIAAATAVYLAFKNWDKITAFVQRTYEAIKTWIGDRLGRLIDWVGRKVEGLIAPFRNLYNAVVGRSYVPDMVDGIATEMARLDQVMVSPVEAAVGAVQGRFGAMGTPFEQWAASIPQTAERINHALGQIGTYALDDLSQGIADVVMGAKSLGDMFRNVARRMLADIAALIARMLVLRAVQGIMGAIFPAAGGGNIVRGGATGAGGGAFGNLPNIPGAARGASGTFGGLGGVDQNMLSMNGQPFLKVSRGESFNVVPAGGGGRGQIVVNVDARDAVLTDTVKRWVMEGIAAAAPDIMQGATRQTMRTMQRPRLG